MDISIVLFGNARQTDLYVGQQFLNRINYFTSENKF